MNALNYLGYSDWRLPDAKELQSIIQYGGIELPAVDTQYFDLSRADSYMWTSTTSGDFPDTALYFAFGKAWGINLMSGGAPPADFGADRDKTGNPPPERPEYKSENITDTPDAVEVSMDDFVDTHGPGAMRNDYKDTTGKALQAPELSRQFWSKLYGEEYPYDFNPADSTTMFDLSASENAADYIVIYNYALLVRDAN